MNLPMVSVPAHLSTESEQSTYTQGKISNGYGRASGFVVSAQKGTSANIAIHMNVHTISVDTFEQWKSSVKETFTQEQWSKLEENYGAAGFAGGFFSGAFGILFGAGDYNHYKNSSGSFHSEHDEKKEGFLKKTYDLQEGNFNADGTLTAVGVSMIPVEVTAFVQSTTIEFQDGKTLHVINTANPVAATPSGDTKGVESKPTKLTLNQP